MTSPALLKGHGLVENTFIKPMPCMLMASTAFREQVQSLRYVLSQEVELLLNEGDVPVGCNATSEDACMTQKHHFLDPTCALPVH